MINMSKVIEGLYFVEIPEVNLYIQCGSPTESVKHLAKKRFIKQTSKNGTTFETGPNAILLSDVMIQNGEFSNISEFSVLQMLYKQGLIIPNHPNNTGMKPLLLGDEAQVVSQMEYIYRGNYGLISQEEIEACGVDKKEAQELFNMKLKFAFGKLQPLSNILDSLFISSSKVEIRDGVFIKRNSINNFEISYKEESVHIDLNLKEDHIYISPYILPEYRLKKEYFSIIQSGQGDGWDTTRPSMNSVICFRGKYYLVDVVPNINYILDALSISINEIEGVFLTHCHDDHIGGITTLIRSDKKIKIFGAKIVTSSMIKKLSALLLLDASEFRNLLDIRDLEIDKWNDIEGLEVQPIISPHPVETTIFIFRAFFKDRYYTYGHYSDILDSKLLEDMITKDSNKPGVTREFYDKTLEVYSKTLDIKKVDIGAGMIHGHHHDFYNDKSGKLILGHNDHELSKDQLKVGTSSLFGLQDVLIPSKQNYDYKSVIKYLNINFGKTSTAGLEIFLNLEIKLFNPKELFYKSNQKIENLYLIIEGLVEKTSYRSNNTVILEPGVIIGEKAALNDININATYMTRNYVKALEIPVESFKYFVKKYNFDKYYSSKFEIGNNFLNNKLFCENISYTTISNLIENMMILKVNNNDFKYNENFVYIVIKGAVDITINDIILDRVVEGSYFGGFKGVLNVPSIFKYVLKEDCILYSLPSSFLKNIPIVFWKILEYHRILQKSLINFSIYNSSQSTFLWNKAYGINIEEMDKEHQKQLEYLDNINMYIVNDESIEKLCNKLDELYDYSQKHFENEEVLMKKHSFEGFIEHQNIHKELLVKMLVFKDELIKGTLDKNFIAVILKEWLLQHILEEDIKYSRFLNSKGVY